MMPWLLTVLYFLVLLFIIRRSKFFLPEQITFSLAALAFLFKTAAGILLGVVYRLHYHGEGDAIGYFNYGNAVYSVFLSHPADYFRILLGINTNTAYYHENYFIRWPFWFNEKFEFFFNDSRTIIRLNSFFRIFSFGVYNVHVVFFSFLSFAGLSGLYRFFSQCIRSQHKIFYAAVFMLPSVAFWGSGVIKESLVFFTLGFTLYLAQKKSKQMSILSFILLILFCFLLALVKFYYLIALLPAFAVLLWCGNRKNIFIKFILVHTVFVLLLYSTKYIFPDYDAAVVISFKQNNFINFAEKMNAGSLIHTEKLEPYWSDIILHSPKAFLTTLITPLELSAEKNFVALASLETLFILFLIVIVTIFFQRPEKDSYPYMLFALSFVIITFVLIGLTTPVAGTLVRYKVISLPFLMFVIFQLTDFGKIKLFLSRKTSVNVINS